MQMAPFYEPVSEHVWHAQYQWSEVGHPQEPSIDATWDRVALALSAAEAHDRHDWRQRFRSILADFKFLPGERILAVAGTQVRQSLFDCFAAGGVEDSVSSIFNALRESMVTLQAGSATGIDFSTVRPATTAAIASGRLATGPVSFMHIWDSAASVIGAGNRHHGTMMATLRCDHPDVESFIAAKGDSTALPRFKLSLLVGDDFLRALEQNESWPLVFPLGKHSVPVGSEVCTRVLPGSSVPVPCLVHHRIPARALWDKLLLAQQVCGQPYVLFSDRINSGNNLWYCQQQQTASPTGTIPLEPHGCVSQGAVNLTRFVRQAFGPHPHVDFDGLRGVVAVATRMLDNVHDISLFPLKAQEKAAHASRSVGIGVTGLADMFAMLGLRFGSAASLDLTRSIMESIRDTAYRASIEIAQEKGPFPAFDKVRYGASPFVLDLARDIQQGIAQHGIRNSHLLAVSPSNSTNLLANNVSGGVAPILALQNRQQVCGYDGKNVEFSLQDHAWHQYLASSKDDAARPDYFVQALDVTAEEQLQVMASVQACVDQAIGVELQFPAHTGLQALELGMLQARELGLKGYAAHCHSGAER
jgi:ribonucleoside-diphosphate reductase alpha chain